MAVIGQALQRALPGNRGEVIEMHLKDGWNRFVEHVWIRLWLWQACQEVRT